MSSDDQTNGRAPEDPAKREPHAQTARMPAQGDAGRPHEQPVAVLQAGRYELVERVGAGSIGQVWRAEDTTLQREVAIKTVNLAMSADPTTEARFRREAVATAGLDHPNVVQIYDSGVDGHTAFLVMEFLRGPNLQTLVNRDGPIPFKDAVPLLAQVAAGLEAAHAIGVTHRDVKPANVMLDADSYQATPKLVDFGIARLNDQQATALTSTMTAIGSAAYMSPEQASGERVNQASDMYSFGCLITTVLTGHPPFPGESPIAVARAQVYDTPTPLRQLRADCPPALESLVSALLTKDQSSRPDASQTEAALWAIANDPTAPATVKAPQALPGADSETLALPSPTAQQTAPTAVESPQATGSLVRTDLDGTGMTAGGTSRQPQSPGARTPAEKAASRHIRGITVAVLVLAILAMAVWLAWARGRHDAAPAPSSTVTMTETHSASATVTPTDTATNDTTGTETGAGADTAAGGGSQPTQQASDQNQQQSPGTGDGGAGQTTGYPQAPTSSAPTTTQTTEPTDTGGAAQTHTTATSTQTAANPTTTTGQAAGITTTTKDNPTAAS